MKPLLPVALLIAGVQLSGQVCVPDTITYTSPGIYPDSATGIPEATENMPYEIVITMIVPPDTVVDIGGGPQFVTIDSIVLQEIVDKPAWMLYECEPPYCGFPGGEASCARFHGTPPVGSAGSYPIDVIIMQHGKLSSFPVAIPDTLYDFYTVVVLPATGLETLDPLRLVNMPNPYAIGDVLEIQSDRNALTSISLYDMAGRLSVRESFQANTGSNFVTLPIERLMPGSYLLRVQSGNAALNHKVVVLD